MSPLLILLAYVAAVNPARIRQALPETDGRGRIQPLLLGALIVVALTAGLVAAATSILDALDITDETWRIGSGIVVGLVGIVTVVLPSAGDEPVLDGWAASIVPVAFPLLITPQLVALAVVFGATESFGLAFVMAVVAIGAGVATGLMRVAHPSLWRATSRLLGALLVIVAIALVVEGIRDV
jgi:small neutral amino acid transporter SnatA (MarC family)